MVSSRAVLEDAGERRAIEAIRKCYRYSWPDDDCYYFIAGNKYILVKADSMTLRSHVPDEADPVKAGYFFAASGLSDIAAMGGVPRFFMSSIIMPRNTRIEYLLKLEKGISRCLDRYNVKMVGGDLKEGNAAMTGIAIGSVEKDRIIRRKGARPGDLLCVTGSLGKNAAAYHMWKREKSSRWANALLDIEPRINDGRLISKAGATSAMDLSDGVYSAAYQLGGINRCGFEIDYAKLPLDESAVMVNKRLGTPIEELALNFGGEYELIFTISESAYRKARPIFDRNGTGTTQIGRVIEGPSVLLKNGKRKTIVQRGYEHFVR